MAAVICVMVAFLTILAQSTCLLANGDDTPNERILSGAIVVFGFLLAMYVYRLYLRWKLMPLSQDSVTKGRGIRKRSFPVAIFGLGVREGRGIRPRVQNLRPSVFRFRTPYPFCPRGKRAAHPTLSFRVRTACGFAAAPRTLHQRTPFRAHPPVISHPAFVGIYFSRL